MSKYGVFSGPYLDTFHAVFAKCLFNYLCDIIVRDNKTVVYLGSPRKIDFNLVSISEMFQKMGFKN